MLKITPDMCFFSDGFNAYRIPNYMVEGLELYINNRIKPGSFTMAVLANDLKEAVGKADNKNMRNIPAYIYFLYNFAPPECFGSYEKVAAWLKGSAE